MSQTPDDSIIQGEVIDIDLKDCLVYGSEGEKIIAAIGLKGLIVVDTRDALLICSKDRSQEVKKVIDKLKNAKKDKYL